MASKLPVFQIMAKNSVPLKGITVYRGTVNFVALDQLQRTSATVSCEGVELGDVVLGVGADSNLGADLIVTGAVIADGSVRLSARYDGHLTDGINAPDSAVTVVVAHI